MLILGLEHASGTQELTGVGRKAVIEMKQNQQQSGRIGSKPQRMKKGQMPDEG